jgi:hypothetical protein
MTRAQIEALAAQHGLNPATDRLYVVGVRGYYRDTMGVAGANDRGVYDDALFLVTPDWFGAFNGNTDPSRFRAGVGTGAAKGIAMLVPGLYRVHRFDIHNGKYMALCERAGPVRVLRDGSPRPYEDVGSFGINIHRGGDGTTSSLGCQTIPPSEWAEFYGKAEAAAKALFGNAWRSTVVPYLLVDKATADAATAGGGTPPPAVARPTPPPAPAPAAQSAPEWGMDAVLGAVGGLFAGIGGPVAVAVAAAQDAAASPPAVNGMMTPKAFIAGFIGTHEGTLSVHPDDNGNWFDLARYRHRPVLPQRRGMGVNVGSKFGVTAYALADYRVAKGMPLDQALNITHQTMAGLDFDTAVDVGMVLFYGGPGFDQLVWNRVTMSIMDKGWGSGPGTAVRMMQRMIGSNVDGKIGPNTARTYAAFIAQHGEEGAAHLWADVRIAFDHDLASNEGDDDPDRKFIGGWNNRSRSFLPGTPWWREAGGGS